MEISPFVLKSLVKLGVAVLALVAYCVWYDRAREESRKASCQGNLKEIGLSMMQYAQDYDGHLPLVVGRNQPSQPTSTDFGWADALQPYGKSVNMLLCPSDVWSLTSQRPQNFYTDFWMNARLSGAKTSGLAITNVVLSGDGIGDERGTARYALSSPPDEQVVCGGRNGACGNAWKHLGGANFLFVDGHVKWLLPVQVSTRKSDRFTFAP